MKYLPATQDSTVDLTLQLLQLQNETSPTVALNGASVCIPYKNPLAFITAVMQYLPTLRLFFPGGVCNDYRLRDGRVEFRINKGLWRTLDNSELQLHYRFHTEVSRWLLRHDADANPYAPEAMRRAK